MNCHFHIIAHLDSSLKHGNETPRY